MCNGSADALDILIVSLSVCNEKRKTVHSPIISLCCFQVRSYWPPQCSGDVLAIGKFINPLKSSLLCRDAGMTSSSIVSRPALYSWILVGCPCSKLKCISPVLAAWWGVSMSSDRSLSWKRQNLLSWIAFWLLSISVSWCIYHKALKFGESSSSGYYKMRLPNRDVIIWF